MWEMCYRHIGYVIACQCRRFVCARGEVCDEEEKVSRVSGTKVWMMSGRELEQAGEVIVGP